MTRSRWDRRRLGALVAALALAGAGCGRGDAGRDRAEGADEVDPVAPSEASSPFTVGSLPERFEVVTLGRGELEDGSWGEDCCGTTEPYTVLSPDGTPGHAEVVVVATTGYAGYEGGLAQASAGYTEDLEELEVDGHEALYAAPPIGGGWGDLVVALDDELALRVTSPGASREELVEVAEAAEVPDGDAAMRDGPSVPSPPAGLRPVGSARLEAVLDPHPAAEPDDVAPPGPTSAHVVAWVDPVPTSTAAAAAGGDRHDSLVVATLPGRAGDAAALAVPRPPAEGEPAPELRTIDGRPAYVTFDRGEYDAHRSVYLDAGWGDLVVVTASGEGDLPSADELVAVAASVEPTDPTTWLGAVQAGVVPVVADVPASDPVPPSEASSPFAVGEPSVLWTPSAIGRGPTPREGDADPYAVLSPDGSPEHPDVVVVAATAGGLEQASAGGGDGARSVRVDGAEGLYTPPGPGGAWADLVVARGDVVIRAASPEGDEQHLAAVVEATVAPAAEGAAPEVPEPPDGLVVIGRADADAVLARSAQPDLAPPAGGGASSAHTATWTSAEDGEVSALAVHTLPGASADIEALAVPTGADDPGSTRIEAVEIEDRRALLVEWTRAGEPVRAVLLDSAWGDTVVVVAEGSRYVDSTELIRLAASVEPVDEATWQEAARAQSPPG